MVPDRQQSVLDIAVGELPHPEQDIVAMQQSSLPSSTSCLQGPNGARASVGVSMVHTANNASLGFSFDEITDAGHRNIPKNNDNISQGWAAKLYEQHPLPGLGLPTAVLHLTTSGTILTSTTASSIEGRTQPANNDGSVLSKRRKVNTRPNAAIAARADSTPLTISLPGTAAQATVGAVQPRLRVVCNEGGRESATRTSTKPTAPRCTESKASNKKENIMSPDSSRRAVTAAAAKITPGCLLAKTAVAPPIAMGAAATDSQTWPPSTAVVQTEKGPGYSNIPPQQEQQPRSPDGVRDAGKTSQQKGGGCGKGVNSPAMVIPEYDIYSSSNKSHQAELKRRAFLELAEADIDRVNLERDFAVKNARFERARVAHTMVHERWMKTKTIFEGTSEAANVYFIAQQMAEREHAVARNNMRAAKAGVKLAEESWALAHAEAGEAVKVFRAKDAVKTKTAALLRASSDNEETRKVGTEAALTAMMEASPALAVMVSGTDESSGSDDGLASNQIFSFPSTRKRSLSDTDDGVPDSTSSNFAAQIVKDKVVSQSPAHEGSGGFKMGASGEDDKGFLISTTTTSRRRSTVGISAVSEDEKRCWSFAKGLGIERQIGASNASQNASVAGGGLAGASDVTIAPANTGGATVPSAVAAATALDFDLEAAKFELTEASRKLVRAFESAGRAAVELGLARVVFDLQGTTRREAEALKARQNATDKAWPYVAWVNKEVDAERRLQVLSNKLMGAASETWEARERARKALNKAGERISRAVLVLKRFSRGDRIDMGRHTLFKAVVEEQQLQQQQQQQKMKKQ